MALAVEQFTAPGKFYIDLAMEKINYEIENSKPVYIGTINAKLKTAMFKDNPHYSIINKKNGNRQR